MKYFLWFLIIPLALAASSGSGLCDSGSDKPDAGKSPTDTSALPATTAQAEKAISQVMMDKLSNAVGSEYVIGSEDVLDITAGGILICQGKCKYVPMGEFQCRSFVTW